MIDDAFLPDQVHREVAAALMAVCGQDARRFAAEQADATDGGNRDIWLAVLALIPCDRASRSH